MWAWIRVVEEISGIVVARSWIRGFDDGGRWQNFDVIGVVLCCRKVRYE